MENGHPDVSESILPNGCCQTSVWLLQSRLGLLGPSPQTCHPAALLSAAEHPQTLRAPVILSAAAALSVNQPELGWTGPPPALPHPSISASASSSLLAFLPPEVLELQPRCDGVDGQAAGPVLAQPQPEGRAELWAVPAARRREGGQLPGGRAPAAGLPPPSQQRRPSSGGGRSALTFLLQKAFQTFYLNLYGPNNHRIFSSLQFRYKSRVYKQPQVEEKQISKLHTKVRANEQLLYWPQWFYWCYTGQSGQYNTSKEDQWTEVGINVTVLTVHVLPVPSLEGLPRLLQAVDSSHCLVSSHLFGAPSQSISVCASD